MTGCQREKPNTQVAKDRGMQGVRHRREVVIFENQGRSLYGMVHVPEREGPVPGVVILHGFGGNKCGKHRLYVNVANLLAAQGIAVLRFDMTGCGDSDGEHHELTLEGAISDSVVATEFLACYPDVDADRIGIIGRSLGGLIAVIVAATYPAVKSLALWAPVFGADQWKDHWEQHMAQGGGAAPEGGIVWFQGEPTSLPFVQQFFSIKLDNELKKISQLPVAHFHGSKDEVVDIQHAHKYRHCREHATGITKFHELHKSDHDFTDPADQVTLLKETCQWFVKTL